MQAGSVGWLWVGRTNWLQHKLCDGSLFQTPRNDGLMSTALGDSLDRQGCTWGNVPQ